PWSPAPIAAIFSSADFPWRDSSAVSTPPAISGDCSSIAVRTAQDSASNPYFALVYPISLIVCLTIAGISKYVVVDISPETSTIPVVKAVSQATLARGSCFKISSRIPAKIGLDIFSGCPSVTDSEVNNHHYADNHKHHY